MTEAPLEAQLPDVPGYRIERVLGRGGFGVVFVAADASGRRVALKVATAGDSTATAQLARENAALRAVGPPVAPAVLGSGKVPDGSPYLVLELLEPPTLAQRLREIAGPMERAELAARAAALCDAVGTVHSSGYLHLDLKPENVFLTPAAVRLIDFGLARPLRERLDRGGAFAGTAEYASPEQCEERAELDVRADVYALGVLLFEMLTRRPPFTGDAQAVREAHIGVRPPRPSQLAPVPAAVEEVVLRALAKDRARRYASAAELSAALERALAENAPAERAKRDAATPSQPRLERRQVGLLLFASTSDAGSVQAAVRSLGGELGWTGRGRYAAVFPGEAGQDPVRRAFRAAQGLAERKLVVRALVDLGAIKAQRRTDGQVRYLAPELGREDRYAAEADPMGPLATADSIKFARPYLPASVSGSSIRTRSTVPTGRSTSFPSVAAIVPPPPIRMPASAPFAPPRIAPRIAPAPAPMPMRSASPRMPSLSSACVTVARIGYDRWLIVKRSNDTVSRPVRSRRVALVTDVTVPRIVAPAGTST